MGFGLRDYQDDKADIIHRYSPEEARTLKMLKELPAKARIDIDTVDAPSDEIIDPRDNVDPNDYLGLGDLSESEDDEDDDEDEEDEEEDFYDDDSHDSELDAL